MNRASKSFPKELQLILRTCGIASTLHNGGHTLIISDMSEFLIVTGVRKVEGIPSYMRDPNTTKTPLFMVREAVTWWNANIKTIYKDLNENDTWGTKRSLVTRMKEDHQPKLKTFHRFCKETGCPIQLIYPVQSHFNCRPRH